MTKRLVEIASELVAAQALAGHVPPESLEKTLERVFSALQKMQQAGIGEEMTDLSVPHPAAATSSRGMETTADGEREEPGRGSESERERVPGSMEEDSSPQHGRTITLPLADLEEKQKPAAGKLCPYCDKEEAVRVKRQSWMRLLPGSKLYRCDFCRTRFLSVNGCVLKVPRLHIL